MKERSITYLFICSINDEKFLNNSGFCVFALFFFFFFFYFSFEANETNFVILLFLKIRLALKFTHC